MPKVAEDQQEDFNTLPQYLGLSDEIVAKEITPSEKFGQHCLGVSVQKGELGASDGPNTGPNYILGENVYQRGIVKLRLKLGSFRNNDWMFVGTVKGDVVQPNNDSYLWRGVYTGCPKKNGTRIN